MELKMRALGVLRTAFSCYVADSGGHLDGVEQLLAGKALLDAAVQLAHQALAHPHVQHDVAIAHIQALQQQYRSPACP